MAKLRVGVQVGEFLAGDGAAGLFSDLPPPFPAGSVPIGWVVADYISQVPLPVSRLLSFGQWEALEGETEAGLGKEVLLPGSLGTLLAVAAFLHGSSFH